mmetsp:Transcript_55269/g.63201  ORF Transcript_55269/g.63201 Transcript_55269/m.63201 type:complete len:421 (+) Transcript_55269:127-1389(+)
MAVRTLQFLIGAPVVIATGYTGGNSLYHKFDSDNTQLLYIRNEVNQKVVENMKTVKKGFAPTPYLPTNPIFQCGMGFLFKFVKGVHYAEEYVKLPDGGQMKLYWEEEGVKMERPKAIIVVSPGVTGGASSDYIKDFVRRGADNHFRVVVIHNRGIEHPLLTPKTHHAGSTDDFGLAIDHIKRGNPGVPLFGFGISMGGNMTLKYVGEKGEDCPYSAVAVVSVPYDITICAEEMARQPIYDKVLTKNFVNGLLSPNVDIIRKLEKSHGLDIERGLAAEKTFDYDEAITTKIFGFKTPFDYYEAVSCKHWLDKIAIPTFCLHSRDDPVCIEGCIPHDKIEKNHNIVMMKTKRGGHIDFFSGLSPRRWWPDPCIEYFNFMFDHLGLYQGHSEQLRDSEEELLHQINHDLPDQTNSAVNHAEAK